MKSIYNDVYHVPIIFSTFMHFLQYTKHQHSCSWYFNKHHHYHWMGSSDNSHSPPKWKNLSSIITSLSVHALWPVYISSLSLVHLYLSCVDGGSITVEVGLSNMRRQMNVHLFSFNIPFDGDSCFNSGASVAHLTPCFHIVVHGSWAAGCTMHPH